VAGVVGLRTMAVGLTTAAHHGGNRARAQIAQTQELLEELGAVSF
jgi:hypothetical protein